MKKNKQLLDIANKSIDRLNDEDFKDKLLSDDFAKQNKQRNERTKFSRKLTIKALASFMTCIVIVLTVLLCTMFIKPTEQDSKHYYAYEDIYTQNISVEDVDEAIKFKISYDNVVKSIIAKDKKSDDILYYVLEIEDEENFMSCSVRLIVNSYFQPIKKETDQVVFIDGLEVKIYKKTNFMQDECVYSHEAYAEIKIGDTRVIIDNYEKLSEFEDNDFEDFIEKLF